MNSNHASRKDAKKMARALAIIFLVLGITCQFLLTGERFTAGIQGIVFSGISIALCIYVYRFSREDAKRNEARIVAVISAAIIFIHAVQLPQNYKIQQEHHRMIENARAISRQLEAVGKIEP